MNRLLLALLVPAAFAADWNDSIRRDHPRLYFNADTWPAVKARALGREAARFDAMKKRVERLPAVLVEDRDYGIEASEAAFVALVTGDTATRELAVRLLAHSAARYVRRHREKRAVNWYTFSRIQAIAAFDWLFPSLSETRRRDIGRDLLHAVRDAQPTKERRPFIGADLGGMDRENWGDTRTGFYSTPSLLWFAGLAAFREGIDDGLAAAFLERGRQLQLEVLSHRRTAAGDDGGAASATLGYWLGAYPWAEFNFFHTWRSATGQDLAADWPYAASLGSYLLWNWLPGMREFGAGDAYHTTNQMPGAGVRTHLAQIVHFFGRTQPEYAAVARWLSDLAPESDGRAFLWTRFLLDDPPRLPSPGDIAARLPLARHFENMGQTFFRSGSGAADTYALFSAGGILTQHRHFDANHFGIFKQGFLALDTGTRPQPGQHLSHYYARTIAHNAILIHMPGEKMPSYWGADPGLGEEKLPFPNDGGQNSVGGSKVVAFESRPEYAYVAGDATATYNREKCRLALRQFVFVAPDFFVVCDRVVSTDPSYRKKWLLHTVEEPALGGDTFAAGHEEGRLFARTLLPARARIASIGGPGRQFFSDGRDWPLPKNWRTTGDTPLLGQWRVEVSPAEPSRGDLFLHLLQAAGRSAPRMVESSLVGDGGSQGVRFANSAGEWEVRFGTEGPASGHIRLARAGKVVFDRALANAVAPQKGLYGE